MKTGLAIFRFDGADVRTVVIDGEPWFVAADVARVLGYRMASDFTRRLDEDEKGTHSARTPGGMQDVTIVSESGLYVAVIGSQVPAARAFKRWITHDVIPALRRTGTYSTAPALPQSYADALRELASATRLYVLENINTLDGFDHLGPGDMHALREFFQAEADERLGRWRWPAPGGGLDFVVTANVPGCSDWDITVTCEQSGESMHYTRADDEGGYPGANCFADAARAYFDAHPEPKPWHEAKPGEVWIVDTHIRTWGGEQAMFVDEDRFNNSSWSIPVSDPEVRSARRIWPEVSS